MLFPEKKFYEKYPFTTGVIRKTNVDLSAIFVDKKITIAGWQTILASNNFAVCSHLTYKIHSQNNASIPLLPFCSVEDKWIKEIYLSNDAAQAGVSIDLIIVHPPTKLNYTGIYSQTIDTEGSITSILSKINYNLLHGDLTAFTEIIQYLTPGIATYIHNFAIDKRVKLIALHVENDFASEIRIEIYSTTVAQLIFRFEYPATTRYVSSGPNFPVFTTPGMFNLGPLPIGWLKPETGERIVVRASSTGNNISQFNIHSLEEI